MHEDKKQGKTLNILDHLQARKERAAARLANMRGKQFCFALLGLKTSVDQFEFLPGVRLQAVEDPPNEIELAQCLKSRGDFVAIGRYSTAIRYELAVDAKFGETEQAAFNLAWWLIAALRVRSLAEFLVPLVADHSWSTIAGAPEESCVAKLLEDVPQAYRLKEPVEVTRSDLEWVSEHLLTFPTLLENERFRLAVEALCTHQHHPTKRMMAAVLWSGIEALFSIESELSFRIACYAAAVLEPRGKSRSDVFKRVKSLYSVRSKAVHGASVTDDELSKHVVEVRNLLSRLLCMFTEAKHLPGRHEFDEALFT